VTNNPDIIVLDNFYPDADSIRTHALGLRYGKEADAKYPGVYAETFQNILEPLTPLARRAGVPNAKWDVRQGDFRVATEADTTNRLTTVHSDLVRWSAVIYLSPERKGAGTFFYRHKATGLKMMPPPNYPKWHELYNSLAADTNDLTKWEVVDEVEMKYNRALLFNGWLFHSSTPDLFGDSLETGRLTQHFFFDPYWP